MTSRTVVIPGHLAKHIDKAIAAGECASAEDLVSELLAGWTRRHEDRADEQAWLRAAINSALDDPRPGLSMDEVRDHLKAVSAKAAARRNAAA